MKVLLISDIHANLPALEAIAAAESDAQLVLFAGDMVDFGYYPHEVIEWFRTQNCICVSGNHDREIVALSHSEHAIPKEGEFPSYAQYDLSRMTKEDLEYLANLPVEAHFEIDGVSYYMAHYYGHGAKESKECFEQCYLKMEYIPAFEKLWREKCPDDHSTRRCAIFGHSHRSIVLHRGGNSMIINPGAVGYQLGPDCLFASGADYMVIEDGQVMPRHVEYDTTSLVHKINTVKLREDAMRTADVLFHTALYPERYESELGGYLDKFSIL